MEFNTFFIFMHAKTAEDFLGCSYFNLIYLNLAATTCIATAIVTVVIAAASPQNNEKNDNPATVTAAENAVRTHVFSSFLCYTTYYFEKPVCVTKRFAYFFIRWYNMAVLFLKGLFYGLCIESCPAL